MRLRWVAALVAFAALVGGGMLTIDARVRLLVFNTLLLGLGTAAIAIPLGMVLGFFIARTNIWGRRFATAILVLLLLTPLYLVAAGWEAGVGRQGWLALPIGDSATPFLDHWRGAIWVHAMAAVAWVALIVGVALRQTIRQHEEQALLDASMTQVVSRITLRRIAPALGVSFLFILLTVATDMTASDLYRIRTYAEEAYQGFPLGDDPVVTIANVAPVVGFLTCTAATAGGVLAFFAATDIAHSEKEPLRFSLGRGKHVAATFVFFILAMLLIFPLLNLVTKAGMVAELTNVGIERRWSAWQAVRLTCTAPYEFADSLVWSWCIGITAASVSTVLAVFAGWFGSRSVVVGGLMFFCCALLLALPGPIVSSIVKLLLLRVDVSFLIYLVDRTIFPTVLVVLAKSFPPACFICWFGFRSLSPAIFESAVMAGAGGLRQLFQVAIPNRLRTIGLAFVASLALAIGDLSHSIGVLPAGIDTLPRRMFGLLHAGSDDRASALAIFNLAIFAVLAIIVIALFARSVQSRRVNLGERGA